MADHSKIEWTDATWQPITGCSIVSPGCTNCYAMKLAGTRLRHHPSRAGLTIDTKAGPVWNGKVRFNEEWLLQPLSWRKPKMIFVCAHGDLFHEDIPDELIDKVFAVMALAPQHTFQVPTKRAARMKKYASSPSALYRIARACLDLALADNRLFSIIPWPVASVGDIDDPSDITMKLWPLPNVWLGVSTERQQEADERIPLLLRTPAAMRFISAEPLLGPIDLRNFDAPALGRRGWSALKDERNIPTLDWVIVGGESGAGARPMHPDWARSLRDQCAAADVPFFFKQWGGWLPGEANRGQFDGRPMHAYRRCDDHSYEWPQHKETRNFGTHEDRFSGDLTTKLVGKKAAGRLLDGIQHNGMPKVPA